MWGTATSSTAWSAKATIVEALGDDRYRLRTPVESEDDRIIDGEAVVLIDEAPA